MSEEIERRPGGELVPALTPEQVIGCAEKPLRLLPAEWRPVVWGFWAKWSDLLKTQLSLCVTLREWVAADGLALDDARAAFAALDRPERRAALRFPGDVLAELAAEVARVLAARRKAERQAAERASDLAWKAEALPAAEVQAALAKVGDLAAGTQP